jgi:hypothetical protein
MPKIRQYRPAFFDGFKNEDRPFKSTKELLKIPFVKNFSADKDFFQYSIEKEPSETTLMAEFKKGYEWLVVGFIVPSRSKVELPKWEPKERKK